MGPSIEKSVKNVDNKSRDFVASLVFNRI